MARQACFYSGLGLWAAGCVELALLPPMLWTVTSTALGIAMMLPQLRYWRITGDW